MHKSNIVEKIGYGLGDMSSSMFWKIFSYYLPFFYSNIFGLRLVDAGILVLITRIWDAVSDPMMGIIADRTHTRWGKYRPYLLWVAPFFSLVGILLFTTPDLHYTGKLVWAYATYLLMMTVYTAINVPYGAMLGVMTADSEEKTIFSSYRMFFAYAGSFIALAAWEPLCRLFQGMNFSLQTNWQLSMVVIAAACLVLFILCFLLTKERLHTVSTVSVGKDIKSLMHNGPWWILIVAALCFNLFCTVRGATVAYYFSDIIGFNQYLRLGEWSVLFYAGLFLGIGEIANMAGVMLTVPIAKHLGKKTTFIAVNMGLVGLSILFFFIPVSPPGFWLILLLQVLISVLTGIMSPLIWSMYADVSDYAEYKFHTASTGLIFSSSSMAQKFGGAFGGAAVLWLLASCEYIVRTDAQMTAQVAILQTDQAQMCLRALMSFIPAGVALLSIIVCRMYSLTTQKMGAINEELAKKRQIETK